MTVTVDTRTSDTNLDKYNERYSDMAAARRICFFCMVRPPDTGPVAGASSAHSIAQLLCFVNGYYKFVTLQYLPDSKKTAVVSSTAVISFY